MASLGLWTLPFCSLACFSSDVLVALHRFPSSHAPVFLGCHLNGVGPLPPPAATTITARRQGPPVDRRARGTWTATLDYVQKTLHLGALLLASQDDQSEYARDERSGLLVLLSARCAATPRRGAIQASSTRPARSALSQHAVTLPASRFASHSIAPHAASAPRYRLCTIFGASDPLGTISQGIRTGSEPLRKEARLLGPALCQLLRNPQQSRPKPQQT